MKKWYQDTYRRNLIDMHINDTDDVYLSKFSAEDYFNYLKEANIVSPMIYLQSHVGLCNFPTEVSKIHNHFLSSPHEIKKLVSLCKEARMKVVGYYSLIFKIGLYPFSIKSQHNATALSLLLYAPICT